MCSLVHQVDNQNAIFHVTIYNLWLQLSYQKYVDISGQTFLKYRNSFYILKS